MATTTLIDAENVRRSEWPNLSKEEFARKCGRWAEFEGVRVIVVFDGEAPEVEGVVTEGTGSGSADDRIVELAADLSGPIWLVSSDRELRSRIGFRAQRGIGGGTFIRELRSLHWGDWSRRTGSDLPV